jgi:glyoxylase-like metal-dependent hydrolase (beta-lactamase superfamily II)
MADDIPFNNSFDITHGVTDQISPLVRRIVAPNASPFTFKGTCTYIVGKGEVAVIDPGPLNDAHLDAIRHELRDETITHILVTHTHNDHSPGAHILASETGASTYAYGPHVTPPADANQPNLDAANDREFEPTHHMDHGDLIEANDWSFECVFTPGHTANHMAYSLREENALFSGDHVMAWATSVVAPPDGNMTTYMESLALLKERKDRLYWPGHGGPVSNPNPFVRAFITHRKMRERAIFERIEKGDRTVEAIVDKVYRGLSERLVFAARLSALAHIQDLAQRGRIIAEQADNQTVYLPVR